MRSHAIKKRTVTFIDNDQLQKLFFQLKFLIFVQ